MDENKKTKRAKILTVILSIMLPVLMIVTIISVVNAWYTNVIQTGEINASTQNLAIKYKINNSTENITTYTISNLAFFDADNENEGEYLEDMAFKITIDLENNSSTEVNYSIIFEANKVDTSRNNNVVSRAYPACIFDDVTKDTTNHTTVNSYITNSTYNTYSNTTTKYTATKTSASSLDIKSGNVVPDSAKASIDLYVFGIQDVDLASSDDFLYTSNRQATRTYTFTLTIKSEAVGGASVSENENS